MWRPARSSAVVSGATFHDGLGPTLASLRLQLGAARRSLRSESAAAEALLDARRADVADATAVIRRLVYDLRPPLLDEYGLAGALRSLSRLVEPQPLWLELPEELPTLPAAVEMALYRVVLARCASRPDPQTGPGLGARGGTEGEMGRVMLARRNTGPPCHHRIGMIEAKHRSVDRQRPAEVRAGGLALAQRGAELPHAQ